MRLFNRLNFHKIYNQFVSRNISKSIIDIKPEVLECLNGTGALVALETTIITHGMPYPVNYETTRACEDIIRSEGCTPAVIGIIKGRIKVGLSDDELKYLAEGTDKCVKTSRRDFPFVLSNNLNGGTTVSGTVLVANQVGIKIFATGGLGGVHRLGESTMDVSADLTELGRNQIMVVSSGVKSILDIGRTLEFLETQGVLVCSYKNDGMMPAFFSKKSNFKTPYSLSSPEHAAAVLKSLTDMDLKSGILLAVPIPEEHSIDYDSMEHIISNALKEANNNGIVGKEITPFLLDKINKLTKGKSLESNIALIKNNSKIAAKIAASYSNLSCKQKSFKDPMHSFSDFKSPVVIGGSVADVTVSLKDDCKFDGRTVDGQIEHFCGGVGRNLADALGKLNLKPSFISAVGNDPNGHLILNSLNHIDKSLIDVLNNENTASYMVLLDHKGDCLICSGNSDIHSKTNIQQVAKHINRIHDSNMIIIDSNLDEGTIEYILNISTKSKTPVWIEPTSLLKCHKMLNCKSLDAICYISPNLIELRQMSKYVGSGFNEEFRDNIDDILKQVVYLSNDLIKKIKVNLMITMGKFGTFMINSNEKIGRYYPVSVNSNVINASGAGDCGAAGFISGYLQGLTEQQCVYLAHSASEASLASKSPVPDSFNFTNCNKFAQFTEISIR